MDYTKEELELKNIHVLRQIGREKGVKAPSALRKSQLIENIIGIDKGEIAPHVSVAGRPALDENFTANKKEKTDKQEKKKQIKKIINEFTTKLLEILS